MARNGSYLRGEPRARRGPDGRFLPGTKPPRSPGRPPGPNGAKARAARLAGEALERLLGRAAAVIEDELEGGNAAVAMWLVDRVRPPRSSDYISLPLVAGLKAPEQVLEAGELAVLAAGRGEISASDARAWLDILARYAELKGLRELEGLRETLAELKAASVDGAGQSVVQLPTWYHSRPPGARTAVGDG